MCGLDLVGVSGDGVARGAGAGASQPAVHGQPQAGPGVPELAWLDGGGWRPRSEAGEHGEVPSAPAAARAVARLGGLARAVA